MKIAAVDIVPEQLPELLVALRLCGLTIAGTLEAPEQALYPRCRFLIGGEALPARCATEFLLVSLTVTSRPGNYSLTPQIIGPVEGKRFVA